MEDGFQEYEEKKKAEAQAKKDAEELRKKKEEAERLEWFARIVLETFPGTPLTAKKFIAVNGYRDTFSPAMTFEVKGEGYDLYAPRKGHLALYTRADDGHGSKLLHTFSEPFKQEDFYPYLR